MFEYDTAILKRNIKKIMHERTPKITQSMLSENTGIPQTRISKVLSEKSSDCFTIQQLVAISKYFCVSTEALLFDNTSTNNERLSVQEVCKYIVKIDKTIGFNIVEKEIEENYTWFNRFEDNYETQNNIVKYLLLWIREYETPEEIGKNDYLYVDTMGSSHKREYEEINSFIKKYFTLRELVNKETISMDIFEDVVNSHIAKLSSYKITDYTKC